MTVPVGGPATINGVLYQMLWCLLQAAKIYVHERGFEKDDRDNEIKSAQLLIEPAGGGGDAQRGPRIVQLKAKSDEGSWSLQDVIAMVFPDLYRAAAPQEDGQVFEFVTEGTIGQWGEVYREFFHSLRTRLVPDGNPLDALDDKTEVFKPKSRRETAKSRSFWDRPFYTERTLFLRIAGELRKSKPAAEEPEELTYLKLWHLIGRFEFTGGQTQEQLRREVESLLLAIIPSKDQIGAKCDELIGALSTIATRGNVTIHAADFLGEHGLGSLPLNPEGWPALRNRARTLWQRQCSQLGYEPGQDLRSGLAEATRGRWSPDSPILVLSGESGQGKSWLLYALGDIVSTEPPLVLLIEATGQKESDLAQAKDDFVEMIWGHDEGPALRRIGERIRETVPQFNHPWLTLLIDGLQDGDEADQLARVPWEDWGIRVAVSASPQAAEAIRAASRGRSVQVPVPDFDEEELGSFLQAYCGEQWIEIPGDVRRVLRRPLLASLYRSVADRPSWRPTTEYELLERFWDRLHEGRQVKFPMDASRLHRLAVSIVNSDSDYPWRAGQLDDADLGNEEIERLMRLGWLRRVGRDRFEIAHDRLLNWAVAKGLVEAFRDARLSSTRLAEIVGALFSENSIWAGRMLGYVPMDVMWLLLDPASPVPDVADEVLARLEATRWQPGSELRERLLPTLGERALPILFRRLETAAVSPGAIPEVASLIGAIVQIGGPAVDAETGRLITQDSPLLQRAAMKLLARRPIPGVLDRLWALHRTIAADPSTFRLHELESGLSVRLDAFNALRSCSRLDPGWVERQIASADPRVEPVHDLSYLVASLRDAALWQRCKPALMAKVPPDRLRSLAINVRVHRDYDEVPWLSEQVAKSEDLVGLMALRALAVLDIARAIEAITLLPKDELYMGRNHWLPELLTRDPDAVGARLEKLIDGEPDDWRVMKAFQGHEDRLPSRILEALLSHLERLLDTHLAAGVQSDYPPLIIHLDMLAKVWRPSLLDNFRGRQGTPLEEKLTEWLIRLGPRASLTEDRNGRVDALEVLRKIGGSGLGRVIRHYLDSTSQSSKLDGLEFAFKTPDRQTIERVVCIVTIETLWEGGGRQLPLLQSEGLKTLAATGSWAELVRAVIRWGTWSGPEIHSCRIGESPLEDDVVQPAIDALAVEGDPGFGPILALGIAARRDQLERILKVCREVPADSPTAKGCSITLGLLNDDSAEALSFLTSQLDVEDHGTYAQAALLQIGSEAAHRTLLARLRERFDPTIALALLAWHESPEDVAALIIPHLKSACALRKAELLGCLFDEVEDGGRIDLVLSDPELRAQVAQEALTGEAAIAWMVGARPALIRAFSRWSSQKAYLAARQILHDANSADRERCAFLLSEIDPERAVRDIFALLALERSTKVRWAMGQALAGIASEEQLLAWLGSDSALERRSACFVAGYLGASAWLSDRLAELSNDPDDDVVDAAIEALHRQRLASDLEELIGSYASEKEESRRWLILDAMTALGAPGLEGCPPPDWVLRAVTRMNHPARNYFLGQLEKEQERRAQDAQFRDRGS